MSHKIAENKGERKKLECEKNCRIIWNCYCYWEIVHRKRFFPILKLLWLISINSNRIYWDWTCIFCCCFCYFFCSCRLSLVAFSMFNVSLYIHLFVHSLTPTWIDHFDRIIPQYSSDQCYLMWFGSIARAQAQAHLPSCVYIIGAATLFSFFQF